MFLLIDKPQGLTSHDVVDAVRTITGEHRVGHGGTLDPNASGLLVVGVGRESTRQLSEIAQHTKKTYEAKIFLGETRDTDDVEGKVLTQNTQVIPSKEAVQEVLHEFTGEQMQMPPSYSAIKMKGKKAYELARAGKEVTLEPRKVTVYSIELVEYTYPFLKIIVEVSSGTYIRALARDIGKKLGTGAYLKELRRTKIGEFTIEQAKTLDELESSYR